MKTHKKTTKSSGVTEEIEIPAGIRTEMTGEVLTLTKEQKSVKRRIVGIKAEKKENKIVLSAKKSTKKEKKLLMTYLAHIYNMIRGLQEDFTYKLKICSVHFPMTVTIDKAANEVVIKNFLGEKKERRARIMANVEAQVKGEEIILKSHDLENAGQTAANIETATKINSRDRRVFQDGIFLTERKGEKI